MELFSASVNTFVQRRMQASVRANATDLNGALLSEASSSTQLQATKTGNRAVRIMFAAGGTGGHVYPAISIALELQKLQPDVQVEFVGSRDRMEWLTVPKAGFTIRPIPAAGLKRPVLSSSNVLLPFKLLASIVASWRVLSGFQPHVVVGTGGYVSGPLCLVAAMRRVPVVIQEQNSSPGLTNKLLGSVATLVFIAFHAAADGFPKTKCVLSGNPTRLRMDRYISTLVARRLFFPEMRNGRKEVLLVIGGSLGARSINQVLLKIVIDMLNRNSGRYVIWQTGSQYYDEVVKTVGGHPRLVIQGFIDSMETAYAAADLVVARAGAITCSELMMAGKASILIPSPNVTDDHQTRNARVMERAGAAKIIPDETLSSAPCNLGSTINELLEDGETLNAMSNNAAKLAVPDAGSRIAEQILELVSEVK